MKILVSLLFILLVTSVTAKGQILILLLGDKLSSEKLEFGLEGGLTFTQISHLPQGENWTTYHLGSYFNITLNERLYLHPVFMFRSPMGSEEISPYLLGNDALDQVLAEGSVTRKLKYFSMPVLLKYRFYDYFSFEAGPQLGLLTSAEDVFTASVMGEDDLVYKKDVEEQYRRLDFGLTAGLGYQLLDGKGVNLGIRYYTGLVEIRQDSSGEVHRNTAFYIFAGIPFGRAKDQETTTE